MSNNDAHILVVDDNPATRYATSRVLRSAGWTVSEAQTGQEAIELWKQCPDLIVLDVNLPDIDGFEVCRRIRAQEAHGRTPVLHLSATFVQDTDKIHGLDSGADGYLTHPIEPPVLIATVNAFLRARRAEFAIRESETRFKAIFDNAHNGIAILDSDHRFIEVNPAMCGLLKRECEDIAGRCLLEFVEEDRRPHVVQILDELKSARSWRGSFPLRPAPEETLQLDWHMSTHTPGLWLAIVSDISDQLRYQEERESLLQSERAARAEAERANRLKDEFLATLSHELRNPLSIIVGWARLLNMGGLDEESIREGLETIERSAEAQTQMISDLLDVARITSGKISLEMTPLMPVEILDAAIKAVQPAADAKQLSLLTDLDRQAGPISGDRSRLQQVYWNLLTNAVKFTPKHGRISVTLGRVASNIEIRIADTGLGMPPEMLTQIFERFRQVDATSTREHGGLGLGLAIAKQLVEMHGGTIKAESPGPGHGSTFILTLPIVALRPGSDALLEVTNSKFGQNVSLSDLRVLVVEDDADSRSVLKRLITAGGAETREAALAEQALELIETFRPHVLVSDLGMPHRDGYDLIREVRGRGYSHQTLPAIALTAFARAEDRHRALLAGFQIYLVKPVNPLELTAAIASVTGRMSNSNTPQ